MKKKKNAFTLIELLAIIVILAIIAVITVPIILNIIENSRKGAATDSAYGYKDAINKYYVQELSYNNQLKLNDTYTVTNGTLSGGDFGDEEITSLPIAVSGTVPTSGSLTYSNNVLTEGWLVIGDYRVTFNENGTVTTIKNSGSSSNEQGNGGQSSSVPTIASCPGCKFIYTLDAYAIVGSSDEAYYSSDMPTEDNGLTNDYTTLIGEGGHPYFLGLIESTTNPGKIGRAFACGIENDTPFCLEGYDPSKYSDDDSDDDNVGILNTIFPECGASSSSSPANCYGLSVYAHADDIGYVSVNDINNIGGVYCYVYDEGNVNCNE